MTHQAPTPRAAAAIIAQIAPKADTEDRHYADIDGKEREFTVWFETERTSEPAYSDTDGYSGTAHFLTCTLLGAYAENDNGNVIFAGNKAELEALIGEEAVYAWEQHQAERSVK